MRQLVHVACWLLLSMCISSTVSPAQTEGVPQGQDSIRYVLDDILTTADKMETRVAASTSSVSVVRGQELRSLPVTTFSSLFRSVPGFSIVDMDGTGRNPIINARGFYGGGEAEYNIVLIDGKPVNDLENGLVNWNLVPPGNIETIEIARGGSSPLYGDAALGAVINIRTHSDRPGTKEDVLVGSMGSVLGSLQQRGMFGNNSYRVAVSTDLTDGFRAHSTWSGTNVGGELSLRLSDWSSLNFSTLNQWVEGETPGPLTVSEVAANRTSSSVYYQSDMKDEQRNQLHLDYSGRVSDESVLDVTLSYKRKDGTVRRTFTNPSAIFDPMTFTVIGLYDTTLYGDTKDREARTNQVGLSSQYSLTTGFGGMRYRLVAGINEAYGRLTSKYYDVHTGFASDYNGARLDRDSIVADGSNRRWSHALYVNNELTIADRISFTFGARYDNIDDRFENVLPQSTLSSRHDAFSPKIGLNIRYVDEPDYEGHLYASVNRSFKAPTLDQLADLRPTDVAFFIPIGPSSYLFLPQRLAPISNNTLKPQRGTSYEAGIYQRFMVLPGTTGELSLSVYQIDMVDEIDFDFATFQYQNIVNSRHRGVESGLRLHMLSNLTTFVNYTWTGVRFRSGPNAGNYLKSIPRNSATLGLTYEHPSGLQAGVLWDFVANIPLDDENTVRLPDYNRGSVRVAYVVKPVRLFVDVENISGREFSTTGYVLTGTTYLFPAPGRAFRGGVSIAF